jgi:carboxymethylenebutenolidase
MPDDQPMIADFIGIADKAPRPSRRGFMTATAAAAAGYTMAAGPVRAQAMTTDTNGLTVGMVKVKVKDGEMPAYRAKPANVKNPPVIIVAMEVFGLHEYIRDVCRRWAKLGALAIAPDYYYRTGDLTQISDMQQIFPKVNAKKDSELFSDLDATVAWAKADGGNTGRLGIMGFCRGGRTTWMYSAYNKNLDAAVVFYGPPEGQPSEAMPKNPIDMVKDVKCPVLAFYGAADTGIPLASVTKMEQAMDAAKKKTEFRVYPDAPHGFHADYRQTYRKEVAEDSWKLATNWFKKYKVLA